MRARRIASFGLSAVLAASADYLQSHAWVRRPFTTTVTYKNDKRAKSVVAGARDTKYLWIAIIGGALLGTGIPSAIRGTAFGLARVIIGGIICIVGVILLVVSRRKMWKNKVAVTMGQIQTALAQ